MFRRADEAALRAVQDAYLWLLDRTGVYVATVTSISYLTGKMTWIATRNRPLDWVDVIFISLILLFIQTGWSKQHSGKLDEYNAQARVWRETWMRDSFFLLCPFSTMMTLVTWNGLASACSILDDASVLLVFGYLFTVQLRKREPPEKLVPAVVRQ